jgi:hypothetical protein
VCFQLNAFVSPTKRYWEQKATIEQIRIYYETKQYSQYYISNEKENSLFQEAVPLLLDHYTPLLLAIVDHEELPGFFGYHGCSQQYRIYQDILKAVFEELVQTPLPDDFQFMRIPGDPEFDLEEGAKTFLQMYERKEISIEDKHFYTSALILTKINHAFGTQISLDQLSEDEILILWKPVQDMFNYIDGLAVEDLDLYFNGVRELDWIEDMTWIEGMGYSLQARATTPVKNLKSKDSDPSLETIMSQFLPNVKSASLQKWVDEQLSPTRVFEMLLACGAYCEWTDWVEIVFPYLDH